MAVGEEAADEGTVNGELRFDKDIHNGIAKSEPLES
jgi:hypothetical protein